MNLSRNVEYVGEKHILKKLVKAKKGNEKYLRLCKDLPRDKITLLVLGKSALKECIKLRDF